MFGGYSVRFCGRIWSKQVANILAKTDRGLLASTNTDACGGRIPQRFNMRNLTIAQTGEKSLATATGSVDN